MLRPDAENRPNQQHIEASTLTPEAADAHVTKFVQDGTFIPCQSNGVLTGVWRIPVDATRTERIVLEVINNEYTGKLPSLIPSVWSQLTPEIVAAMNRHVRKIGIQKLPDANKYISVVKVRTRKL